MVKINGTFYDIAGQTLSDYLVQAGYVANRIAVERNGEIIAKTQYDQTVLQEGDVLEIVRFMGGG